MLFKSVFLFSFLIVGLVQSSFIKQTKYADSYCYTDITHIYYFKVDECYRDANYYYMWKDNVGAYERSTHPLSVDECNADRVADICRIASSSKWDKVDILPSSVPEGYKAKVTFRNNTGLCTEGDIIHVDMSPETDCDIPIECGDEFVYHVATGCSGWEYGESYPSTSSSGDDDDTLNEWEEFVQWYNDNEVLAVFLTVVVGVCVCCCCSIIGCVCIVCCCYLKNRKEQILDNELGESKIF